MRVLPYLTASMLALGLATAAQAQNVALTSKGASFVSASSAIDLASQSGTLATMQSDPISDTPTPWYFNGDTRYIFGTGDPAQTYTVDLGQSYSLYAFSASFATADRAISTLAVSTSADGSTYTPYAGLLTESTNGGIGTFTLAGLVSSARYVAYSFGPASTQYGDGGSGVTRVTANAGGDTGAVPEPATWAMMLLGFGMVGVGLRVRRTTVKIALS